MTEQVRINFCEEKEIQAINYVISMCVGVRVRFLKKRGNQVAPKNMGGISCEMRSC